MTNLFSHCKNDPLHLLCKSLVSCPHTGQRKDIPHVLNHLKKRSLNVCWNLNASWFSTVFTSLLIPCFFLISPPAVSIVLDQWERPDGIKRRDHPFSLFLSVFFPLSVSLSLSALSWTVLDCQFSPGFSFLCRADEFPLGLLRRCEGPCPLIILLAPHSSPFSMPLLFSLTVSPHSSHSLSLGLLQRDLLTRPCKNSSTAGC